MSGFLSACKKLASSALLGSNCSPQKCFSFLPRISVFDPEDLVPDGERLQQFCPSIMKYIECFIEEIEFCTAYTLEELASSPNETLSRIGNVFLGAAELFVDLCDKNTAIHKAYAENVVCIRDVLMQPESEQLCLEDGRALYNAYLSKPETNHKSDSDCLMMAYVMACISGELQKDCGEPARATFLEIIKRAKVLKYQICSSEDLGELQTTFIDFLELEGSRRSLFEEAFDLRRRK